MQAYVYCLILASSLLFCRCQNAQSNSISHPSSEGANSIANSAGEHSIPTTKAKNPLSSAPNSLKNTGAAVAQAIPSGINYPWQSTTNQENALCNRINPPAGYQRLPATEGSFVEWLRFMPLKEGRPKVHLFNGKEKQNQNAHFAVIDIDVGNKDLQQCADAVMRLRGEFLYTRQDFAEINFPFTSGDQHFFNDWLEGKRPVINGNKVSWKTVSDGKSGYPLFQAYMQSVFNWSGTYSLSRQLKRRNTTDLKAGDVFIQGGFPGHAVIVMDVAINAEGEKCFLLAQSYMPAQEMHILRNPNQPSNNPWYSIPQNELATPEWTFSANELMYFDQ